VSIRRVVKALGITRSTIYYKRTGYPKQRLTQLRMIDEKAQEAIMKITNQKSTYGVPRVKAILRRDHMVDHTKYMVHRYMQDENLLIKCYRTRGVSRKVSL
jgi:putative transposase